MSDSTFKVLAQLLYPVCICGRRLWWQKVLLAKLWLSFSLPYSTFLYDNEQNKKKQVCYCLTQKPNACYLIRLTFNYHLHLKSPLECNPELTDNIQTNGKTIISHLTDTCGPVSCPSCPLIKLSPVDRQTQIEEMESDRLAPCWCRWWGMT